MIRTIARPPVAETPYTEFVPSPIGTAAENTLAIQAALDRLAARGGGGVIQLPAGVIPYTANPATQVAPNEGAAWMLGAQHSNIAIRGAGKGVTIMKPASNKVEGFVQLGAGNLRYEGITFDNSDNGILQGNAAVSNPVPGSGVAGMGNTTNAAIDQFRGNDLTVVECEFRAFCFGVQYTGNRDDYTQTWGNLIVEGCRFDGCAQGIIVDTARNIHVDGCDYSNGVGSIDELGASAAGHGIYVTNRTSAYPDTVTVSNFSGTNNLDTNLRIRKGKVVTATNCPHYDAVRGHNFENCQTLTVSNCPVKMRPAASDPVPWGLVITDCGHYTISNSVVDCSGTGGIGILLQPSGSSTNPWANHEGVLENITVVHDLAGASADNHPWISLIGQTDVTLRNMAGFLTANVAQSRRFIELTSCTRVHVVRPSKRAAAVGNPAGSNRLVTIQATSTDCTVEWSSLDVDMVTSDTVSDLGTGSKVFRIEGATSGTWTPVPTFATPGDFAPTISIAQGRWLKLGNTVWLTCALFFNTNAYTTAAGSFLLGGVPFPARSSGGIRYTAALGSYAMLSAVTGTDVGVWLDVGATQATFRQSLTGTAGATLSAANVPPSTTGVGVWFTIFYETDPS